MSSINSKVKEAKEWLSFIESQVEMDESCEIKHEKGEGRDSYWLVNKHVPIAVAVVYKRHSGQWNLHKTILK